MNPKHSPFKFLDSYQKKDQKIFFGRKNETIALYNELRGVKHLVIQGLIGAGKTSLIECGLRNQFSDADWFALTIRRGNNLNVSVFREINDQLKQKFEVDSETGMPIDSVVGFGLAVKKLFSEQYKPVFLLFDQFEELLILGTKDEKQDFFENLSLLLNYKVPCRVILIVREEFIGQLGAFKTFCPDIFQHIFHLKRMDIARMKAVVMDILEAEHKKGSLEVDNPKVITKRIFEQLPGGDEGVDLANVQVYLEVLWERASADSRSYTFPRLHPGLVKDGDNLGTILDSFLKAQLAELEPKYGDKLPKEVLAALLSKEHTKLQLTEAEIEESLAIKGIQTKNSLTGLLEDLERRRILRKYSSGHRDVNEIRHDSLALVVWENLTEEIKMRETAKRIYKDYEGREGHLSQEELDHLAPYQRYWPYPVKLDALVGQSQTILKKLRRRDRRRSQLLASLLGAALIALGAAVFFGIYARQAQSEAEDFAMKADSARFEATANLRNALQEKKDRLMIEKENASRAMEIYQRANHEELFDLERLRIDSLDNAITQIDSSIQEYNEKASLFTIVNQFLLKYYRSDSMSSF